MRTRFAALIAVLLLVVAACSIGGSSPAPVELQVYAAASLTGAMDKAKTAYEAANPGTTIVVSPDSSAALATKIEEGAPADVFLSADTANPKKLVDDGFAVAPPVTFATNELVIIVPTANPAGFTVPNDLARTGVKIIAAGPEVPITKYTVQLIDNLAAVPGAPPDFKAAVAANVVSEEQNVKGIVTKVELGEGDAGVVYATDAKASDKVSPVAIVPDTANVPATYDGVVVKASKNQEAAKAFLDWFAGPDGQAILGELGFLPPS